jgi:lysylphosphatidylglycerol synthetase-like protein (DUF2156 family)
MSNTKYYCDDIGGVPGIDQHLNSCYDINVPLVNNIVLWTSITGFVLFFVHVAGLYISCKKFSWRSASIILITAIISVTIFLSAGLRAKYVISVSGKEPKDYKTSGDVIEKGMARNMAYIQVLGNILCLLSIIAFVIWKKSYLYGCDSVFPTMSFGIIIVTWAIMMLYGLVHLATNKIN